MNLGFETIGNATIICHDQRPVLVTDPWLGGSAYFGSWTLSHEIPEEQLRAARACEYVWLSHGHPDHLSLESLEALRGKKLLVPNHFGGRIHRDLKAQGFDVTELVDREWIELSPRIRVLCVPDYNQDAVLLIDVGGALVVNLNDASDHGWGRFVRRIIREYDRSFLLALSGYGDADMINFKDEEGRRIPPPAALRSPVGASIAREAELWGVRYFVPFSSMHRYQRADSLWADEYTTRLPDYARGFDSEKVELLPAFIRYEVDKDALTELRPPERHIHPVEPSAFGDHWDEPLEPGDFAEVERYFRAVRKLDEAIGFLQFRVAGIDHRLELNRQKRARGITFEVPRGSLLTAVRYRIFDDLLIGNFMATTLHGDFGPGGLYPEFSPWVAKYSDNGGARTPEELKNYFAAYARRDRLGFLRHRLEENCVRPLHEQSAQLFRRLVKPDSPLYRTAKKGFWSLRGALS